MPILRELLRQRRTLDQRIADYRQRERPAALASARALAAEYGLTEEEVFGKPARPAARFRLGCYLDPKPAKTRGGAGSAPMCL